MYRPEWLKYTQEQRATLAEHFKMKMSVSVEVVGNELVCDGYPDEQIYAVKKKDADKLLGLTKTKNAKTKEKATVKGGDKGKSKKSTTTEDTRSESVSDSAEE